MERFKDIGMLSWDTVNIHSVESLFQSEGFFWLTTAVATGLAAEEMEQFCAAEAPEINTAQIIALFSQCIRNNDITEAELAQARAWCIELEWQQVLGMEEIEETYQFLNQVLADSEELDQIEQAHNTNSINDDQRLFLRSHWQRSKLFWTNLYANLQLFSRGLISMKMPGRTC